MRIPSEAIPPVGNLSKEPEGERKAAPVGNSTRLANELAASPQDRPLPFGEKKGAAPPAPPIAVAPDQASQPLAVERRQGERRSENRPVLLDTRSKRGRRQNPGEGGINIKV